VGFIPLIFTDFTVVMFA